MTLLLSCALLISLSDFFSIAQESEKPKPKIYKALLVSLILPILTTILTMAEKYVVVSMKVNSADFAFGYWGMMSLVMQISSIAYFNYYGNFIWRYWVFGSIGSAFNCLACYFMILAYSTGAPVGPTIAVLNSQTIVVTIVSIFIFSVVPTWI